MHPYVCFSAHGNVDDGLRRRIDRQTVGAAAQNGQEGDQIECFCDQKISKFGLSLKVADEFFDQGDMEKMQLNIQPIVSQTKERSFISPLKIPRD